METEVKKAPTGLLKALLGAQGDMKTPEKHGKNTFHNYSYSTEEDVLTAIKPALTKHGIVVTTKLLNNEVDPETKLLTISMEFTIWHAESGESLSTTFDGVALYETTGKDGKVARDDKALYKAYTGCCKYFLAKYFLGSTGEDPEADGRTPKKNKEAEEKPAKMTEEQLGKISKLITDSGKTTEQVNKFIATTFKVSGIEKLTGPQADALIARLEKELKVAGIANNINSG